MKHTLLRAVFFASILVAATACNDDDDDNGNPTPTPQFSFSGDRVNPTNGETSTWSADEVTAEIGFFEDDLTIIAKSGSDILTIRIPSLEVRPYGINLDQPFGEDNGYVSVTSTDTLVYSYQFNGSDFDGGGVISITSIDTINKRFDGDIASLQFFNVENGPDDNDQFALQNAVLSNIPYSEETFDIGGSGDDELSLTADGTALTFPNLTTIISGGIISLTGTSTVGLSSFSLSFPSNLTAGSYSIADETLISGSYVNSTGSFIMTSGDLIVTSNASNVIEGTFEFTGTNTGSSGTVSITNGAFAVEY